MRLLLLLSLFVVSATSMAANRVESIQMPAWLIRDNTVSVLRPGTELAPGDQIKTGKDARVYLLLDEGSRVKIGADAMFQIESAAQTDDVEPVYSAVFNIIKGAFRFTTDALFKQKRRNINIHIGTVTAGIRGTDLWGKSNDEKDLVCLLEGRIAVDHPLSSTVELTEAQQFLSADKNLAPGPVSKISDQQLEIWAKTTEQLNGEGTITSQGHYGVNLLSVTSHEAAIKTSDQFNQLGYASDVISIELHGTTWHRVAIRGFASLSDARYFAENINGRYGVSSAWVSQYF